MDKPPSYGHELIFKIGWRIFFQILFYQDICDTAYVKESINAFGVYPKFHGPVPGAPAVMAESVRTLRGDRVRAARSPPA